MPARPAASSLLLMGGQGYYATPVDAGVGSSRYASIGEQHDASEHVLRHRRSRERHGYQLVATARGEARWATG
jgi:hypothetical protein